jgi:alkylhydroperoxidase family enzyme
MSEHIAELRAVVAGTDAPPDVMASYLEKVRDDDIEALKAAGLTEDEIFEQTVATAIGQGLRRFDAAMDAIG